MIGDRYTMALCQGLGCHNSNNDNENHNHNININNNSNSKIIIMKIIITLFVYPDEVEIKQF